MTLLRLSSGQGLAQKTRTNSPPAFSRPAAVAFLLLLGIIETSCGDVYRPVAIPVLGPQPNPAAFHFVVSVSANGPLDAGTASRIDVSGDTNVGVVQTGVAPTHATLATNGARLYVANR